MVLQCFTHVFFSLVLRGGQPRVETLLKHGRSCRHVARYPKMEWQWRSIKRVDHLLQINNNIYGYDRHALFTKKSNSISIIFCPLIWRELFCSPFRQTNPGTQSTHGPWVINRRKWLRELLLQPLFLKWTNKEKDIYGWNGKKHQETIFCLVKTQQICGNTAKPRCFGYKFLLKWWNVP